MQHNARHSLYAIMTFLQSCKAGAGAVMEILRESWGQGNYQLLNGARQKSSHTTKRIFTIAGSVTVVIVFLWYLFSGSPTPQDLHRFPVAYNATPCDHPIAQLASSASQALSKTLETQSKSLGEAVAEYRRRYNMPPPPNFDKWYEFAKERDTLLIDEFDTIYHSILPFWGLEPETIRSRVREDLGFDNALMGISIRSGKPIYLGNGQGEFQRNGTMKQLSKFAQWLPDMDLEFNVHDEPRVVVPHEELNLLVTKGRTNQARLNQELSLSNRFSTDKIEGAIPESFRTRFNNIQRQETWLYSHMSCPPESPARDLDGKAPDNTSAYATTPLGFVFNQSAFSDMCNSPSLRHRLGIFEHPNSFKVTNELTPVFSMSHPSSFQDIPVPSPFYYMGEASFDPEHAIPWDSKKGQIYWRGKTNGGHSYGGSWRNLQRQTIIGKLTYNSSLSVLEPREDANCSLGINEGWEVREGNNTELSEYFNAHFVEIVDCDDDCEAEEKYFETVHREHQSQAWNYKYLLDMDGHAYSGRFYALLRSKSVPLKLTFFREWHDNLIIPWVHYVPLNKDADDIPDILHFFEKYPTGQELAKLIGEQGQMWASKTLRNDDMDVFMFRLMLEYVPAFFQ